MTTPTTPVDLTSETMSDLAGAALSAGTRLNAPRRLVAPSVRQSLTWPAVGLSSGEPCPSRRVPGKEPRARVRAPGPEEQ